MEKKAKLINKYWNQIHKYNSKIADLRAEINKLTATEYYDMVGKFYKVSGGDNGGYYIYVYEVFHADGLIIRGVSFYYEKTGWWDASMFDWRADDDIVIRDLDNPVYNFTEVTREEFEEKFNMYYKSLQEYSTFILDKAINDWTKK